MPFGQIEKAGVAQYFQTLEKIFFVMERLAHPHHYDVSEPAPLLAQKPLGEQNLIEHFGGGQVADKTHRTGCTKLAVGGAANL
jgi:hypothetical protein